MLSEISFFRLAARAEKGGAAGLDEPLDDFAAMKAGFQHVLAVVVGVADPVREAAGAVGYAVVILAL